MFFIMLWTLLQCSFVGYPLTQRVALGRNSVRRSQNEAKGPETVNLKSRTRMKIPFIGIFSKYTLTFCVLSLGKGMVLAGKAFVYSYKSPYE